MAGSVTLSDRPAFAIAQADAAATVTLGDAGSAVALSTASASVTLADGT